jgi:hypothetical protein
MSEIKVNSIKGVGASSAAITVNNTDGTCTANITNNLSNRRMNINGAMLVWQRSTSVSVSDGSNEGVSACDRYGFEYGNSSAGAATISQSTDVPTNLGFPYSFKIDVTTINNNSAANTQIRFPYRFEAQDIVNSGWKYNDSNSFLTISFYFKSNKSGTNKLPVQIRTFDGTAYFYIAEITQSDTNWNRYTVKIPGNSNLTFNNDNEMGLEVAWYFAVGSTYHTTADTWGTAQKHGTSNSTNYFDSTSNDMFITGIQMEATTNGIATDFEHRSFAQELALCQRYYFRLAEGADHVPICMGAAYTASSIHFGIAHFPCKMRANPTVDAPTASSYYREVANNSTSLASGVQIEDANSTCCGIRITGGSSITQGSAIYFRLGNASAYVAFSAEL